MAKAPRRRQLVLAIIATDATYEKVSWRGGTAWQGTCIHCRRRLLVDLTGEPIGDVTVEHIVPRGHGGSDHLENLALACGRCNHQKGYRLDDRRADDPVLRRVIDTLTARRRERWREPERAVTRSAARAGPATRRPRGRRTRRGHRRPRSGS